MNEECDKKQHELEEQSEQLRREIIQSTNEMRVFAEQYLARIRQSCQEVEKTYINNYHSYHKTQAELDDIIRHTHLCENTEIIMLLDRLDTIRGHLHTHGHGE